MIALLADQARDTAERLRDPERTSLVWVTLPEALSLAETGDGIAALERAGMRVGEIVVNRMLPDGGHCPLCDRRRAAERNVITAIRRQFGTGRAIRVVPATITEPRGLRALASLASTSPRLSAVSSRRSALSREPVALRAQPSALSVEPFEGASLQIGRAHV